MSYYINHPEFFNGPVRLSPEEMNDPLSVISRFFDDYSLSEIREHNEQIDHACLSTDSPPFQDPSERDGLLLYRKDEERLMEAALLLLRNPASSLKQLPLGNSPQNTLNPLIGEIDLTDVQKRIVDIQSKVAQLCHIIVKAYGAGISKLLHP